MAIGNKNQNFSNKNVHYVNVITKDDAGKDIKPYFSFKRRGEDGPNGEKVYNEVAKENQFSGTLVKVEPYDREVKNTSATQPRVRVVFEDGDDQYYLDLSYTILSRSFFNCLLSLETRENINVSIYQTKPNDKGKVFPQMSVWVGDTFSKDSMVRWKYEISDLPKIKKVKVKGQEMSDTEDVDNFFRDKLTEKFANFGKEEAAPAEKSKKTEKTEKKAGKTQEVADEDVPF